MRAPPREHSVAVRVSKMNDNTVDTENNPPGWARFLIEGLVVMAIVAISSLTIGGPLRQPSAEKGTMTLEPRSMNLCDIDSDGYLRGRLHGALDEQIDWRGADMDCEGMLRPDGHGIRLLFAAQGNREAKLVFVFGIAGMVETMPGVERAANITIIDETDGRFFSSRGDDRCWATISKLENLDDETISAYQIDGDIYCTGGLPSLSDNRSVTLADFEFSGRLALNES